MGRRHATCRGGIVVPSEERPGELRCLRCKAVVDPKDLEAPR